MNFPGEGVGIGDDNGAGLHRFAGLDVPPFIPQPGEGQHRGVVRRNVIGLLAGRRGFPLVLARGRNEATASLEGSTKYRLRGDRLSAGIEG
jgi:hypothetical protein